MYINYQPQHMSFRSREKQSYFEFKRSVQLRSSLQLLQASHLFRHTSLLTLAGETAARVLLTISPDFEKIRSQGTVVAGK